MGGEELTALIGAYEPGPAGLRALVPLAGATLVEHQCRRAIAAGAGRALLLVDEVTPELAAAVSRLRGDGLAVGLAPGIDAAADALPDQRVLLIADGCLPGEALLKEMAGAAVPAVAEVGDLPGNLSHERLDATTRWAGTALLDGHRVAETAAMLGSWDPVSTLLRRAVQEGAARISAREPPSLLLVEDAVVAAAEREIVAASRAPARDWTERFLFAPLTELALPALLKRPIGATPPMAAAAALALLGGSVAWLGWRWAALVLLMASGPLAIGAARLARIQSRPILRAKAFGWARTIGGAAAALGLAHGLVLASGQWGWWLVAGALFAGVSVSQALERLAPRLLWMASLDGLIWAMLPFAMVGRWEAGLAALAVYAAASAAWQLGRATRA